MDFRALVSGEQRGPLASLARCGLSLLTPFYRAGVALRNVACNRGWLQSARAAVPVVSLGNITTGGTGKTPTAAWVAQWFRAQGVRVCFLSRGYGAKPGEANDEALVLELHCPDVPHLQGANRCESARIACEELDSQLLILDDGFQHRRLQRDLDVVLIDALNPWGYGRLLPRGLLREPLSALRRADVIAITRADRASPEQVAAILDRCQSIRGNRSAVQFAFPPQCLVNASAKVEPLTTLAGRRVAAFCGIGHPEAFRGMLADLGATICQFQEFRDHHAFSRDEVERLREWAAASEVELVVCTEKDLVKLGLDKLGSRPLWAVRIGAKVIAGADVLEDRLREVLGKVPEENEAH